jgi:pimeloyl-ACP methyl ester carboxylesterase
MPMELLKNGAQHHGRSLSGESSRSWRWLTPVLGSAAVLATTAVAVHLRARKAERDNPPRGRFLEIDGVRLHYVERGTGQPVMLLHGNGSMVEDFILSGVLDRASRDYRIIAFDRPGFGHSSRPRGRVWTPQAQAELLAKAMRRLGIEQPIVVGHSWGTLVTLALALDHSHAIKSIVLLSGYYFPTVRADVALFSPAAIPLLGDVLRYTISPILGWLMASHIIRKVFAPSPVSPSFTAFPLAMSLRPSQIRASAEDTGLMIPAAMSFDDRYGELELPVVIMAGSGDKIVEVAQAERLHQAVRHSILRVTDNAGHMIHHIVPERILQAIDLAAQKTPVKTAA